MMSLDPWRTILTDEFGDIVWPRPYYGHPFYREVPSWIHYGDPDSGGGTRRLLFDGAFIGAEVPAYAQETTMMRPYTYAGHYMGAEAAPEASKGTRANGAPATGPITVKKEFNNRQVLHVEICVDGKCYRTSMDLAPAIDLVLTRLAQWHKAQHAATGQLPSPPTVVGAIENAIDAAGDGLVDSLVCQHVNSMMGGFFDAYSPYVDEYGPSAVTVGGFWDSLGGGVLSAYRTVSTPVTWFHKKVNETIRDNPALKQAVVTAASAIASAYGGPAAGQAAAAFAPSIIDSSAETGGDPTMLFEDTKKKASQASGGDPQVDQAISHAQSAVTQTMAIATLTKIAEDALRGDPEALQQISELKARADAGDQVAIRAMSAITQAQQRAQAQRRAQPQPQAQPQRRAQYGVFAR